MALRGSWYPERVAEIENMLGSPKQSPAPGLKAILVPHAGLMYSGKVAVAAYQTIDTAKVKRILLLAPSHHFGLAGCIGVSPFSGAKTPFGDIAYDTAARELLLRENPTTFQCLTTVADAKEHSVEMQLVQLGRIYRDQGVTLLPLVIGKLNEAQRREAVQAIRGAFKHDLLIVTSDFSHFGVNYGWGQSISEKSVDDALEALDREAFEGIRRGTLAEHIARTGNTICGAEPIMLGQHLLSEGSWRLLCYDRSSSSASYQQSSVGYMALCHE
jgi:AmmeMemoRadiSam system protein B